MSTPATTLEDTAEERITRLIKLVSVNSTCPRCNRNTKVIRDRHNAPTHFDRDGTPHKDNCRASWRKGGE